MMYRVEAPHFVAGVVLHDNVVWNAAPILHYMANGKWTEKQVVQYCQQKGWRATKLWD